MADANADVPSQSSLAGSLVAISQGIYRRRRWTRIAAFGLYEVNMLRCNGSSFQKRTSSVLNKVFS